MDRGTDDRAVKIALVKSNLAREDLPEDLSEIVFPVSAMFTCFYFKSSPFTLRTNGASIFPARLLAPRCGASLRDCVDRIAGWMRLGLTRYILNMQCKTLNIFFRKLHRGSALTAAAYLRRETQGGSSPPKSPWSLIWSLPTVTARWRVGTFVSIWRSLQFFHKVCK